MSFELYLSSFLTSVGVLELNPSGSVPIVKDVLVTCLQVLDTRRYKSFATTIMCWIVCVLLVTSLVKNELSKLTHLNFKLIGLKQ